MEPKSFKVIHWNEEKNQLLQIQRKLSFEMVVEKIENLTRYTSGGDKRSGDANAILLECFADFLEIKRFKKRNGNSKRSKISFKFFIITPFMLKYIFMVGLAAPNVKTRFNMKEYSKFYCVFRIYLKCLAWPNLRGNYCGKRHLKIFTRSILSRGGTRVSPVIFSLWHCFDDLI